MSDLNRRNFVTLAVVAAAATCAACACEAQAQEKSAEEKEKESKKPLPKGPFDVGPKSGYDKDGVTDKFAKAERILIVRHEGKIYAPTATCTHKNCAVKVNTKQEIACGCHGSKFTIQGTSMKGPAKGSLGRYAIKVDDKGNLIVNRDKQFAEKEWDSAEAYVTV
jgi:cytochrome b6-f complex iron-sulfur subunit